MSIAEAIDDLADYTDTVIYGDVIAWLGETVRCGECSSGWTTIHRAPTPAAWGREYRDGGRVSQGEILCHNCGRRVNIYD